MFEMLKTLLITAGFALLIWGAYLLLSRYVFCKIKANKWLLLGISIIVFIGSFIIPGTGEPIDILKIGLSGVAAIFFFWFFDVQKLGNPKFKKERNNAVKIKSKAKPNRAKKQ